MFAQLPIVDQLTCTHGLSGHDCPYTFAMGALMLQAVALGAASSYVAVHRGHGGLKWFLVGLLGSVVGLVFALRLPFVERRFVAPRLGKEATTYAPTPCGRCGNENHPAAHRCSACGEALSPIQTASEASRVIE